MIHLDFRNNPEILSFIIDSMADGVFTVNPMAHFVAWNKGAEEITGYKNQDVIGQHCDLLEGINCTGFSFLNAIFSGNMEILNSVYSQECKILSKNGREIYLHCNLRIIKKIDNTVIGAVGTFKDMTSFYEANEKIKILQNQSNPVHSLNRMIGKSKIMQEVFKKIKLAANSEVNVLISGESGTGKEVAAGLIHELSDKAENSFLGINCSAIPETLLESELFGHLKGAFTGAIKDKKGYFEVAENGTILLDEISEISPLIQLKLLRVIQEKEIFRVGDEKAIKVNARLITATNKNLKNLMEERQFREDFYYRINVFEIHIPPLRERKEDISLLVMCFIQDFSEIYKKNVSTITKDALYCLMNYSWPGNVRELRNTIEHAFVTVQTENITIFDLPFEMRQQAYKINNKPKNNTKTFYNAERELVQRALEEANGNKTKASELLGMSRVGLWKKIKRLNIKN